MSQLEGVTPLNREKWNRNKIFGVYRGVIEYTVDPMKLGRVKVRVPNLHSTEKSTPTDHLPWAYPMHHFGGGHDYGSYYIPPVGSTVFVQFEMGDPVRPIYFGTWWKVPYETREMNTKTSRETKDVLPKRPISMGRWDQPVGPEPPQEILSTPYEPTTHILHKTQKGSTVLFEDRDGFEKVRVIDRSGQEIRMICPVTDGMNEFNASQRSTKSVVSGDNIPYDDLAGGTATVEILGASGQGIRIVSKENAEFIEISSKDDKNKTSPTDSQNVVRLLLGGGLGVAEFVGKREGVETVKLTVDLHSGHVELKSNSSLTLSSPILTLIAEILTMKGELSLEGSLMVKGDASFVGTVTGVEEAR